MNHNDSNLSAEQVPRPQENDVPIAELVQRTREALEHQGYSKITLWLYIHRGLMILQRLHEDAGEAYYSEALIMDAVADIRSKYEQDLTSASYYKALRKSASFLQDMRETGTLSLRNLPYWGLREPTPMFADLLQRFCDKTSGEGRLSASSIHEIRNRIRIFLFEMEDKGFTTFESISRKDVNTVVTNLFKRYTGGGLKASLYSVRLFLAFLYEQGITEEDMRNALPRQIVRKYPFHEGFSVEETQKILESVNQEAPLGKRDYAILLLAAQSGLRAVDIAHLKRENIDWHSRKIEIIQHKTQRAVYIPLLPESGNAIARYILDARPDCDLPYVFLCHGRKPSPINRRSVSKMVSRYMKQAGIQNTRRGRAFHAFRRSLGVNLLREETPIEMIRQIMGHSHMDATKSYLSIDEQGLKLCALSLPVPDELEGGV